jgi:hypothetical protein
LISRLVGAVAGWDGLGGDTPGGRRVRRGWITAVQPLVGLVFLVAGVVIPLLVLADDPPLALTSRGDEMNPMPAEHFTRPALALGAAMALGGLAMLLAGALRRVRATVFATALAASLTFLAWVVAVEPALDPFRSARAFALEVARHTESSRAAGHPVLAFDIGNVPRAIAFYSDGIYLRETRKARDLAGHLDRGPGVYALVDSARLDRLPARHRRPHELVARARLSRRTIHLIRSEEAPEVTEASEDEPPAGE